MTDFNKGAVCLGLSFGDFSHLSDRDKKRLVRVMARISERSYRRGFQHGVVCRDEGEIDEKRITDWRYYKNLDKEYRPPGFNFKTTGPFWTSRDRLFCENSDLQHVGFPRDEGKK